LAGGRSVEAEKAVGAPASSPADPAASSPPGKHERQRGRCRRQPAWTPALRLRVDAQRRLEALTTKTDAEVTKVARKPQRETAAPKEEAKKEEKASRWQRLKRWLAEDPSKPKKQ
jgi:hypothetical protein